MACPHCEAPLVRFSVPPDLRTHAPDGGEFAAICSSCLRTAPAAEGDANPTFDAVHESIPDGDGGVAIALALGLLGSFALNRAAVESLCEYAEREGADVILTFDRLADAAAAGEIDPYFDVERRRVALANVLA